MAKKVLVAVYSASGVTRRVGQAIAKVSGDVKWEKGVQINRPNEGTIRKWLDKVL